MNFDDYRALWPYLETGEIWLQHAGVTPLNTRVAAAASEPMAAFSRAPAATYPELWKAVTDDARRAVAGLLDCPATRLAFIRNTSTGLALVAEGLSWPAGSNVVTLSGEFPSNRLPWRYLERRGVEVRTVAANAAGHCPTDAIAAALDDQTRVLAVSWVQFLDGYRQDLAALADLCARRGTFLVVDAIQGLGALPLDLDGLDAVVCGGHKWLCGPEGAGFMYLSERLDAALEPVLVGWHSVGSWTFRAGAEVRAEAVLPPFKPGPERFEEGTPNAWGNLALAEAARMLTEIGPARIAERLFAWQDAFLEAAAAKGYTTSSSLEPGERSGILALTHPRHSAAQIVDALAAARITTVQRGAAVRLAPHFYNNESDAQRTVDALP